MISIIVPVYNERDNILKLLLSITEVMEGAALIYEIIMIDDGSTDDTIAQLIALKPEFEKMRIVQFRRNFGQTAAMAAGFDFARGEVIVPMDGDLQNDPADIPRMIDKLNEGFDVVSGWRKNRKDKLFSRKIPSWIANWIIGKITGVRLHDYGCSLKVYRKEVLQHVNLYGEMHRFIPALAKWYGANVTEMVVNHRPRLHGTTKYGLSRTIKVTLDLITVKFLGTFSTKPLHIFGAFGFLALFLAMICVAFVVGMKIFEGFSMNKNPLLVISAMLTIMSIQFFLMGLLAEMLARTYHESQNKPTYIVKHYMEASQALPETQS